MNSLALEVASRDIRFRARDAHLHFRGLAVQSVLTNRERLWLVVEKRGVVETPRVVVVVPSVGEHIHPGKSVYTRPAVNEFVKEFGKALQHHHHWRWLLVRQVQHCRRDAELH